MPTLTAPDGTLLVYDMYEAATPRAAVLALHGWADLWPTLPVPARLDADTLSRDAAVNGAYAADPAVHGVMTPGAWHEIQWAQRAVPADGYRIESPLLFLLAGEDRVVDAHLARL